MKYDNQSPIRKLKKVLEILNIKVEFGADGIQYIPGKLFDIIRTTLSFNDFINSKRFDFVYSSIAHEIGHWLIVPPKRRRHKDYGIPIDIDQTYGGRIKYDTEEEKAQIIEQYLLWKLNFVKEPSFKKRLSQFSHHKKWFLSDGQKMVDTLINLAS